MHRIVYFDNAATTFPKPRPVREALRRAAEYAGGNPGRGGHPLAARAGEAVYRARETAAAFFDAKPEHVIFTQNCTHALNLAIRGTLRIMSLSAAWSTTPLPDLSRPWQRSS